MSEGRLVYSTQTGGVCQDCNKSLKSCKCNKEKPTSDAGSRSATATNLPRDGIIRVGRESKGRGGKTVTLVHGLSLAPNQLTELATRLKRKCGTGGAIKDGVIEIQGDHRDTLVTELTASGYTVKRMGG
jgi:translation initiation factor 1